MKAPIPWYGGKSFMIKSILPLLPAHHVYVEPFGGAAHLLFAKPPSPVEVYNDLHSGVVNFYRVLRDPEQFEELRRLIELTPKSREEYYYCCGTWADCSDPVEKARRFFTAARQAFAGCIGQGWGFSVTLSRRGMSGAVSKWLSSIDRLAAAHQRLRRVQVEHYDFERIFEIYDTPETLFYCDPPYVAEARREQDVYDHEMTTENHERLVCVLLQMEGMAIVSGYDHPVYDSLIDAGWKKRQFNRPCYAVGRTRHTGVQGENALKDRHYREETIWISPNAVVQRRLI